MPSRHANKTEIDFFYYYYLPDCFKHSAFGKEIVLAVMVSRKFPIGEGGAD